MKQNKKRKSTEKARMVAILVISILVIVTGVFFSYGSLKNGEISGAVLGAIIAIIILAFAIIVFKRGNEDLKNGFPLKDERSRKVMDKASSRAFYVSLYVLLAVGFVSDYLPFRDISQATSISVGLMALLFLGFWIYYNKKEL